MSLDFYPGQKVVAVGGTVPDKLARAGHGHEKKPVNGQVYTVRDVFTEGTYLGLYLEEIINPKGHYFVGNQPIYAEPCFLASLFRPVQERKTDISIFREIDREVFQGRKRRIEDDQFDAPRKKVRAQ